MRNVQGWVRRCVGASLVLILCWLILPGTLLGAPEEVPSGGYGWARDSKESGGQSGSHSGGGGGEVDLGGGTEKVKTCAGWVPKWLCAGYHATVDAVSAAVNAVGQAVSDGWEYVKDSWQNSKVFRAVVYVVLLVVALVVAAVIGTWLLIAVVIGAVIGLVVNVATYWVMAGGDGNWGDALLAGLAGAAVGAWIDVATGGLGKLAAGLKLGGTLARLVPQAAAWWSGLSKTGKGTLILLANMFKDGAIGSVAYVANAVLSGEAVSWRGVAVSFGFGFALGSVFRVRQVWGLVSQTRWGHRITGWFGAGSRIRGIVEARVVAVGQVALHLRTVAGARLATVMQDLRAFGTKAQQYLRSKSTRQGPRVVVEPIPEIAGLQSFRPATDDEALALVSQLVGEPAPGRFNYLSRTAKELPNFDSGYVVQSGTLSEDMVLVQLHSDAPLGAGRSAKYWTSTQQANKFSTVDDYLEYLALIPDWGPRTDISVARIPAGTKVTYVAGAAAPQKSAIAGRVFMGQGLQFLFPEFDPSWIVITKSVR